MNSPRFAPRYSASGKAPFSFIKKSVLVATAMAAVAASASYALNVSAVGLPQMLLSMAGIGSPAPRVSAHLDTLGGIKPLAAAPFADTSVARSGHTATILADGHVLIAGGDAGGTAELYDQSTDTFAATGSMNAARSGHTASMLSDGRVLIVGGTVGGSAVNSTEIYDPATGSFSNGPSINAARSGHTATTLGDGRVVVIGGDTSGSIEVYDPAANSFSVLTATLLSPRANHGAARLANGNILIVGGTAPDGSNVQTGEIINLSDGSVTAVSNSTADEHIRPLMRVLSDGKVQIIGGTDHADMEVYDPAINAFGAHAHVFPIGDSHPELVQQIMDAPTRAALFYDGASTTLTNRHGQTVTELPGSNKALVVGGTDGGGNVLSSSSLVNSSPASITTDKLDYAPGTSVVVTGTGFAANETVTLTFHEDPHPDTENPHTFTVTTDANGNFTDQQYAPEDADVGIAYVLAAVGGTSGYTAQTALHDNKTLIITFTGNGTGTISFTASPIPVPTPCTATCSPALDNNAVGTLTATANTGSTFVGWSGNWNIGNGSGSTTCASGTTTSPCNYSMGNNAQSITATFNTNVATTLTEAAPSPASAFFGSSGPITLSATLTRTVGGAAVSGATLTFKVDGNSVGTAVTNASGVASITTYNPSALSVGNRNVQASFAGQVILSTPFTASSSGNQTLTINKANTTTTITTDNPDPSVTGQAVAVNYSVVASAPGSGIPTGTVTVTASTGESCVGTVAVGTCSVAIYSAGQRSFLASYSGDASFNASSGSALHTVSQANTTSVFMNWNPLSPTGAGPGQGMCGPATFGDGSGRLIVYGQPNCSGLNEEWVLSAANGNGSPTWTQLNTFPTLMTRHGQVAAYDSTSNRLISFGGCTGGCTPVANDVWVLLNANGQGSPTAWTQLSPTGTAPSPRQGGTGAYDPVSNRLIIFGGQDGGGSGGSTFQDVWVLTNANGIGGTPQWIQLTTAGTFPLGQYGTRSFYDPATNRLTVVGGAMHGSGAQSTAVNVLTNANGLGGTPTWINLIPEGAPGSITAFGIPVVYDAANNRALLAAGPGSELTVLSNANGLGGTAAYGHIAPRHGSAGISGMGFDAPTGRLMAFYQTGATNLSNVFMPSSSDSSNFGESVTFTTKIDTVSPGSGSASGTVTFLEGLNILGTANVASGYASITTSSLAAGVHNIVASYSGDANFAQSSSATFTHTVNQAATATTVASSVDPSTFGGSVTFTSTTLSGGNPVPGGTVKFIEGGTCAVPGTLLQIPTALNGSGQVIFTTSALTPPTHTITACYTSSNLSPSNFADSNGSIVQSVNKATLNVTADNKTITYGNADPFFSFQYSGFVPGDGPSSVSSAPICSVSGPHANVGTYPIVCSGGASNNYSFNFVSGTLTVIQKTLTASIIGDPTKPYDGNTNATLSPANFSLTGLVGTDSFSVTKTAGSYNSPDVATANTVSTTLAAADFTPVGATLAANYILPTNASGPGTVTKATPTVSISFAASPINYDGHPHAASATVNGVSGALTGADGSTVITYTKGGDPFAGTPTDVGSYLASATFTATNSNYTNASTSTPASLTINKATAIVVVTPYSVTYDALSHSAAIASITGVNGETGSTVGTVDVSHTAHTNAATYSADYWTFTGTLNYNDISNTTITDQIDRANATCSVNGFTGSYDGAGHGASGACTGVGGASDILSGLSLGGTFTNVPGGTANWSFVDVTGNYNNTSGTAAIVINKAASVTTVTCLAGPFVYTGSAQTPCSATVTGPGGLSLAPAPDYSNNTNAGTATASYTYVESANYFGSNDSKDFEIMQASSETTVTCPTSVAYNGSAQEPCSVNVTRIGAPSLTAFTPSYTNNRNVGTAHASYTYAGDMNHTGSSGQGMFDITAVALTISGAVAQNKVYDGTNAATVDFTAAALVTPISDDHVSIDAAGNSATFDNENVGNDKPVTVTGVVLSGSDAGNYTLSQPSGLKANITKKPLTLVGAIAQDKVYDGLTDAVVMFPASPSGLTTLATGDEVGFDTSGYAAHFAGKNVGTGIGVTVTGVVLTGSDAGNYDLAQPAGLTANITTRLVTVTINNQTKVYDGTTNAVLNSTDFMVGNTVPGEAFSVDQTVGAYNNANVVGATTVSASLTPGNFGPVNPATLSTNYSYPSSASGSGTITAATPSVSVSFAASPVTYDGLQHPATATVTGVSVDGILALPTNGSVAITYSPSGIPINAGVYSASAVFTSANTNYTNASSSTPALLTINKADATFTVTPYTVTYDGQPHAASVTAVTGVHGETGSTVGTLDVNNTIHTAAGTYSADYWFFTGTLNYNSVGNTTITDQINKAPVTATAGSGSAVYDGAAKSPASCVITGAGFTGDLTCANDPLTVGPDAGTYPIAPNVSGTGLTNFDITSVPGSYIINQAPSTTTVTFETGSYVYRATPFTATANVSGAGTLNQSVMVVYTGDCTNVSVHDGCTATANFAGDTNHLASMDAKSITITKADAMVTVNGYSGIYDGAAHGATGSATGVGGVNLSAGLGFGLTFTNVPGGSAHWTFTGGTNYNDQTGDVAIVISKATATVSVTGFSGVFDGNPHGVVSSSAVGVNSESLSGLVVDNTTYVNVHGGSVHWTFTNNNYTDQAGDATVTITKYVFNVCDGDGHCAGGSLPNDVNVGGRLTISPIVQYGGNATATVDLSPASLGTTDSLVSSDVNVPLPIQFKVYIAPVADAAHPVFFGSGNATKVNGGTAWNTSITAALNTTLAPGNYVAYVYGDDGATLTSNAVDADTGYDKAATVNFSYPTLTAPITISRATPTITATGGTFTYDGNAHGGSGSASGVGGSADILSPAVTLSYDTLSGLAPVDAGTYHVTAHFAGSDNYLAGDSAPAVIIIQPKDTTASVTAADKFYDGTTAATIATCIVDGKIGSDDVTCGAGGPNTFAAKDVGTHQVTATNIALSGAKSGNYNLTPTTATTTAKINAVTLTASIVGDPTKTYDGNTNASLTSANFSIAGLVSGESFTVNKSSGSYNNANVAMANSVSTTLAPADFSPVGGTLASNYDLPTAASGPGHITPAHPTLATTGGIFTFDGDSHPSVGTAMGIDGTTNVTGGFVYTYTPPGSGSAPVNALSTPYQVSAAFTSGDTNYDNGTPATNSITINKASSSTLINCPAHVTFTGLALEPCTAAVTGAGGLSTSTSVVYTNNTNAGTATANSSYGGDSNHDPSTATQATFAIDKASANCSVTGFSGVYDGSLHGATGSCTGLGGLSDVLSGLIVATTQYRNVPAGAVHWTFSNQNYSDQSGDANVVINKAPITVTVTAGQTKVYGNADPLPFAYSVTSGNLKGTDGFTGALTRSPGETVATYPISIGTLAINDGNGGNNYNLSFTGAGFSITQRPATWITNANNKNFGTTDPSPLTTGNSNSGGFLAADGVTATYTRDAGEAAGMYHITATLGPSAAVLNNYSITNAGSTFTINSWWTLNGFYSPIGLPNTYHIPSPPMAGITWNSVKGGQTVPLKFNVFAGAIEQTNVSAVKSFTSMDVSCITAGTNDEPVDLTTTGNTSLRYDGTPGAGGQFIQNWQTPKTADKCYEVILTTQDNSYLVSFFKTKK